MSMASQMDTSVRHYFGLSRLWKAYFTIRDQQFCRGHQEVYDTRCGFDVGISWDVRPGLLAQKYHEPMDVSKVQYLYLFEILLDDFENSIWGIVLDALSTGSLRISEHFVRI
jgi:hypothetical protein